MIVDEEEQIKVNNKKRPLVRDEDEVAVIEEPLPEVPKAPVTPAKASAKKSKLDSGKAEDVVASKSKVLSKVAPASSSKAQVVEEEVKENVPVNVIGPPKDIEKLKAPSNPSYHPIEDAPFYKG